MANPFFKMLITFIVIVMLTMAEFSCYACDQLPLPIVKTSQKSISAQQTDDDWMAQVHQSITNSVYQSALWFDSFFAERGCPQRHPQTSARVSLTWRPKAEHLSGFRSRFRLNLKLPNFQNKADLILSDNSNDGLNQLPLDNLNKHNTLNNNQAFSAAIRFIHKNEVNKFTDSRIGISGGDIFLRVRHQRLYAWRNTQGFKIEPAVFYFIKKGLGANLLLEYNYQLSQQSQLRVDYSVSASHSYRGLRWQQGIYRLAQLGEGKASVFSFAMEGERTNHNYFVNKYTVSYRYRFNAMRAWLFFEVEPFVEWQKDENFKAGPGIALTVEGYFTKL